MPGLFLSFYSALDSGISVLLDCVLTLPWDPGLRKPGLKVFHPTVPQSEMAVSSDMVEMED